MNKKNMIENIEKRPEVIKQDKEYNKEYSKRPEVITRKRKYDKEHSKKYYEKNKEKILKKQKEHYNIPEINKRKKEYQKEYQTKPKVNERIKAYRKEYNRRVEYIIHIKEYNKRPEVKARKKELHAKYHQHDIKYRQNLRLKAFNILGGYKCIKCSYDKNIIALQIDHIFSYAHNHDKYQEGRLDGTKLYIWIIKNPEKAKEKYQVLCANCNMIKKDEKKEYPNTYGDEK